MAISCADLAFLAEANSKQWLSAVLLQGERCITALNVLRDQHQAEEARHASNTMRIEEHFFVIALGKAMDWVSELAEQRTACRPAIEHFLSRLPHAREVRNMREHDVEYFKGKGRRQSHFVNDHSDEDGQVVVRADASSTVVFGDQYLIGGRLDLRNVLGVSKELLVVLEKHDFRGTEQTPTPAMHRTCAKSRAGR